MSNRPSKQTMQTRAYEIVCPKCSHIDHKTLAWLEHHETYRCPCGIEFPLLNREDILYAYGIIDRKTMTKQ